MSYLGSLSLGRKGTSWLLTREPPPSSKCRELIGSELLPVTRVYTSPALGMFLGNSFMPTTEGLRMNRMFLEVGAAIFDFRR